MPAEVTPLWKALLRRSADSNGEPKLVSCFENVAVILNNEEAFKGCFARNELSGETELVKKLPAVGRHLLPRRGTLDDYVVSHTRMALSAICGLTVGREACIEGIEYAARQCCYNPLQDYLRSLIWDGVPRLGSWLSTYLGADRTPYTEAIGRWWLVSAMARAFEPGCQVDHMLVLEGPQGAGKSSAARILAGKWYLGKLPNVREYERAAFAIAGVWMAEIAELEALRGAASSQVKEFISQTVDRYRPPYGRFAVAQLRTCVFIGTTNDAQYLRDTTGARRFWPVRVGTIDRDALTRDRDRLLAEARVAYEDKCSWHPDPTMAVDLAEEQEARHEADEWEVKIAAWLSEPRGIQIGQGEGAHGEPRDGVTTGDVLKGALNVDPKDWTRDAQTRVGTALRRLTFEPKQQREQGVKVRRYWRKEGS